MSTNIYIKEINVTDDHIDDLNHVNNVQYVQWIQEIAGEHWIKTTGIENSANQFWVVHEHKIRYKKQVYLGECLYIKTFVEPYEGIRFPRIVEFYRNDQLVVEAKTYWILLDHKNRPKRLESKTLALFGL